VVEFGRATGNARAEAFGYAVLAAHWLFALDYEHERAEAASGAGAAAAKDPLFRAGNHALRSMALLSMGQVGLALELSGECLPYLERNENRWFALQMAPVCDAAEVANGQMSAGMRRLVGGLRRADATGSVASGSFAAFNLLATYVSVACAKAKPPLGVLLRNPWFVLTQAPFAARKARSLIDHLRAVITEQARYGSRIMVDFYDARLRVCRHNKAEARESSAKSRHACATRASTRCRR
jgi:hypothetical protein